MAAHLLRPTGRVLQPVVLHVLGQKAQAVGQEIPVPTMDLLGYLPQNPVWRDLRSCGVHGRWTHLHGGWGVVVGGVPTSIALLAAEL